MKQAVLSLRMMDSANPDMQVGELLDQHPELARLFVDRRLDCLGCPMNRFCTLGDVSTQYEIEIGSLIQQMKERINTYESNTNING